MMISNGSNNKNNTSEDSQDVLKYVRVRPPSIVWEGSGVGSGNVTPEPQSAVRVAAKMRYDAPDDLLPHKVDSALSSMDYWDYSVELECLSGPDGKDLRPRP